jgi:hypothetical protein
MRNVVVHDQNEASMWVSCGRLPDGIIVEDDVMPLPETLLRSNAWGFALGHVGHVGGPDVELTSVAILVGKVELNEPVPMDVDVDIFDVGGVAEQGVVASDEGRTVGLKGDVGTNVHKAKKGWRRRHQATLRRG